jgi:4-carboxymuconolactone decarboxylase
MLAAGSCAESAALTSRTARRENNQGDRMARIPFVKENDVPKAERGAYDAFVKRRGKQPDAGPYALLLHMPELALRYESVRLLIREEASVPQPLQEIVMLTVAREMDCPYIWQAHAAAAKEAGVRAGIVDGLRERRALTGLSRHEQTVVDFTRELLRNRKVSKVTFDQANSAFGQRGAMTLTNLIGAYAMLAYFMNAYELEAPAHATEPALPV